VSAGGQTLAGQEFGAQLTTDLAASYTFMERYTLTVGASNLFNTYPDKIAATASNPIYTLTNGLADGQVNPRSGGPFGINGGFWFASVRVQF
jgi:iron complex outermembrane receptor protein